MIGIKTTGSNGTDVLLPRRRSSAMFEMCGGRPLQEEECQIARWRYHGFRDFGAGFGILRKPLHTPMTDPSYAPRPDDSDPFVAAYRQQFEFLRLLATQRFGIPVADAEAIVQEVFVTYLRRQPHVNDERQWLIAGVCNASRAYWRSVAKHDALRDGRSPAPPHSERIGSQLDARTLLRRLPRKCREVLRLKFYDDLSAAEIADRFHTSTGYAKLMIHRCLAAARDLLRGREGAS
jgi:RNA polymerase sigma factor (sigma-70 family)